MNPQNKTIKISPELFQLPSSTKTVRNKSKPQVTSLIRPNMLKQSLIRKVKDHKTREASKKGNTISKETTNTTTSSSVDDDFNSSLRYLQELAKKKETEGKVLDSLVAVNLELPEELKEKKSLGVRFSDALVEMEPDPPSVKKENGAQGAYNKDAFVPYGCLKRGNKQTYRQWKVNSTRKNGISGLLEQGKTEREKKLDLLKQRWRKQQEEKSMEKMFDEPLLAVPKPPHVAIVADPNFITNVGPITNVSPITNVGPITSAVPITSVLQSQTPIIEGMIDLEPTISTNELVSVPPNQPLSQSMKDMVSSLDLDKVPSSQENKVSLGLGLAPAAFNSQAQAAGAQGAPEEKKYEKIITKRKFILGKSKKKNIVAVCIKNNKTRKEIIEAQKGLKNESIQEIKKYLRERCLIQSGSNAPNHILRKIYESSKMTGEINNNNREKMMEHFMKEE